MKWLAQLADTFIAFGEPFPLFGLRKGLQRQISSHGPDRAGNDGLHLGFDSLPGLTEEVLHPLAWAAALEVGGNGFTHQW